MMFAWQETWSPITWPANGDARAAGVGRDPAAGVDDGHLPAARAGVAREQVGERVARRPPRQQLERLRAVRISTFAWVATAPTPGCAQGTTGPTENQCDWTATPSSPVPLSRATIE